MLKRPSTASIVRGFKWAVRSAARAEIERRHFQVADRTIVASLAS